MSQPIILLEDEPLINALCTWVCWMATMVIFLMFIIYYSNYFGRERFITEVKPVQMNSWKSAFNVSDALTYV